ncbi:MAG: hypothetical protein KatS3mg098_520 [Candidatus Parcubacteria bacterium]|nr:MAG: hypothetical protein KatS3mg098_520 [Candidatus Parcubacteria bacterium]
MTERRYKNNYPYPPEKENSEGNLVERVVNQKDLEEARKAVKDFYESSSPDQRVAFFWEMNNFASLLLSKIGERVRKNPLFHLLAGSTLPQEDEDKMIKKGGLVDYSGNFSILDFIKKLFQKIKNDSEGK